MRAIDRDGALVDVMLSEHRDLAAANAFFDRPRLSPASPRTGSRRTATTRIPGQSGQSWKACAASDELDTWIIALSRITVASRADVDRCSASRAPRQQGAIAGGTTNSEISCASDPACANTCLR